MGAVRDLVLADKFRDACGVVGIYGHPDAANLAYLSLYAMLHRGQESAGIVAWNGTRMLVEKGMGYVAEVFDQTRLARLPGRLAIGHVRYSTTGMSLLENAQPIVYNTNKGPLGIAHNGNLVNAGEIRRELEQEGSIFTTSSDTEVFVEAVRHRLPELPLMVDANSAYTLQDADHLAALDAFGLMMIEQPLAWNDIVDHATLQKRLATPICLDESIRSEDDARRALELGACRIVNVKVGRVGGFAGAVAVHDACRARGVPVWCGGMLESGIGRLANVHQTLPNFTLPGDTAASARYFEEDLVDPPVEVAPDGTIAVPGGPGIGHAIVWPRVERATGFTAETSADPG